MKDELLKRVEQGYVTAIRNKDLTIYNYSNKCVFDRAWDEFTMAARGLVLHDTGEVYARPWPKFFNLNERPETKLETLPKETPELSHKYDGSLIIVFFDDLAQDWRAITRGCWKNVQTEYAQRWLEEHSWRLRLSYTYLFELIAPWNRIVIPYAKDEMVLLGMVETETGKDHSYAEIAEEGKERELRCVEFETRPVESLALDDPKVRDREGFVARYSNGLRVKLKYQQYMILHKILTGLSVKGIWEILASGNEPTFENVPDEFMDWYRKQRDGLKAKYAEAEGRAKAVFNATPKYGTRKEYALDFMKHKDLSGTLFSMLDGHNYAPTIWKRLKPEGQTPVFKVDDTP